MKIKTLRVFKDDIKCEWGYKNVDIIMPMIGSGPTVKYLNLTSILNKIIL